MPRPRRDPYTVLEVSRNASASELRAAYRRLVQLHHPDHNGGSAESARRFEEVQEAYAAVLASRREEPRAAAASASGPSAASGASVDSDLETRVADIERQVREAHAARERARQAARRAAMQTEERATDEELGYITTDDSFSKVLADALDELAARLKKRD